MTDLARFQQRYPFALDDFQVRAIQALDADESVLVAAPTGSGKTVVAEFAVERALSRRRKAFYTTPLKALSNQKFGDFIARYGSARVGLLTGDNSINSEAPVVVMTTEVLRNMLYEGSPTLDGLECVVLDEVHYLQDPYRGAVWEEVLIHLPLSVAVVCLSATVSNAEEFGEWIGALRGPTRVVIEERRPVPLRNLYLVGRELHDMHVEHDGHLIPNPYLVSMSQRETRVREWKPRAGGRYGRSQLARMERPREGHRRFYVPRREEVVEVLDHEGMLPAIYFVFSRAGCDASVRYLMGSGIRLTSKEEAERILEVADHQAAWIDDEELATLGYYEFREALAAGIAAHHAGMLPVFKETVERLFQVGLVKVVFATETLSLGINMPAKTVVIEDLWKFSGERHELLTPGEYTQFTGRAGRRGIDEVGYAVVLYQKQVPFERVAGLASTRTYELRSSFRPSYNMAVNLVSNYTREEARHLLNSSFAQFLADRGVVTLERQLERDRAYLDGYRARVSCDRGDFAEYWRLREQAERIREDARRSGERHREDEAKTALASLRPGDVIFVPSPRRQALAVVMGSREGRPTVLTQERRYFRLSARDFDEPPRPVARIDLPRSGSARSARVRRDLAARLATLGVRPSRARLPRRDPAAARKATELERQAARHPCHACPDRPEHERWAARASKLEKEVAALERRIRSRTETLGRQFDRVLAVLHELGYVRGFSLTEKGNVLRRIYGEGDILVVEALSDGMFAGLSPSELAALVSALVYESRERIPRKVDIPTRELRTRYRSLSSQWSRVRAVEDSHQVELCRELDPGFMDTVFGWAEGKALEDVLSSSGLTPGDFVRNCKQLVDLLQQVDEVAGPELSPAFRAAHQSVNRSVVAYTGL
ncbi:MAG TPA: DEAD/DEAH box helicase [Actinomycetota bacterium]|nr:DEAD/DEAH box helicase [Actinomycetota bacterium]